MALNALTIYYGDWIIPEPMAITARPEILAVSLGHVEAATLEWAHRHHTERTDE